MKTLRLRTDLPPHVSEAFKDLFIRLGLSPVVTRLRREVLTTREAELLEKAGVPDNGPPQKVAMAVISVVTTERRISPERALLDLAFRGDLLSNGRYESYRNFINEPVSNRRVLPTWDSDACELRLDGNVIRKVARHAKNPRLILDAFQELGWENYIDSPLPGGKHSRQLREAVRCLNRRLTKIRFFSDGGVGIRWQHTD